LSYRIEPGEPYFHDLRERWSAALRAAHNAIPRPPYAGTASGGVIGGVIAPRPLR
jgi:putative proteasome-type protease